MSYLVGPKGQVVIEKGIRDRLGVKPGWRALQVLVGDHVEIHFLPPEHGRSVAGSLSRYVEEGRAAARTPEALREARAAAWEEAAERRMAGGSAEEAG